MSALANDVGPNTAALAGPVLSSDAVYFGLKAWDVDSLRADAEPHGFRTAEMSELPEAHRFSEDIMNMRLAPLWALASAHAHTQGAAWICHDLSAKRQDDRPKLSGIFLILPLNWDGEAALRTRRFNFAIPRIDELCAPGDEVAAVYFWFCAGGDRDARRSVMRTTQAWLDGALAGLRIYGRAASEDGVRGFATFGFRRLAPARSDLFVLDQHR